MIKDKSQNLRICKIKGLLKSFCTETPAINLDTNAINWLVQTGLGSIVLDYAILPSNNKIPAKTLAVNKLSGQFWFQAQLNATKNIVEELNKLGIVPTLLKGMSISTSLYPKPYYRIMRDIDLLVDVDEVDKTEKILSRLGFEQRSTYSEDFYKMLHHTMPWQHSGDDVWVEVHKKLFPKTSLCSNSPVFQLNVIQKEKVPDDFYGLKVYRLGKEFQIIYIATHWAERFKQVGGMFALLDTALLINKHNDNIDWNKVIAWSNTPSVSNYVYLMLWYLDKNNLLKATINIDAHYNRIKHSLGYLALIILNKLIDDYLLEGKDFGRILTVDNTTSVWRHLLKPSPGLLKVLLIPLVIIFPEKNDKKFDFKSQWSRFKSFLNHRKQ